jgi:hypothetical protein
MSANISGLFGASATPAGSFSLSDFGNTLKVGLASTGLATLLAVLAYFSAHVGDFTTGTWTVIIGGALSMVIDVLHRFQSGNKIGTP